MQTTQSGEGKKREMKAELTLPEDFTDQIVEKLFDRLKPFLSDNGKKGNDDFLFDVPGLAAYLKASNKWIYERVQFKEIPYLKINGLLRFRKKDIEKWLQTCHVLAVHSLDKKP